MSWHPRFASTASGRAAWRAICAGRRRSAIRAILPLQFFPDPADFTGPFVLLASRANNRTLSGVMINADCGLGIRGIRHVAGGLDL